MYKPKINPDNAIFWENCKKKKLVFQKCKNCGKIRWPYSIACPECYSFEYEFIESKGNGKIYSYVIYNVPFDKNFKDKVPYIVAIIELDEGVKFLSNIVDTDFNNLKCEQKVNLFWEKQDEYYIPKFKIKN